MAPKKKARGGGKKRSRLPDDDDSEPDSLLDGLNPDEEEVRTPKSKVSFGAQFMLFRVLMLATVPVSFAKGSGNVAKLLAQAAEKGATWNRCGADGKDGRQHTHHFPDSRVHRVGREVGFLRENQSEIDSDPRSRRVYADFRREVNQIRSHVQRVKNQSMFERYCLEYHPARSYSDFLRQCENSGPEAEPIPFQAPSKDIVFSYACLLRVGDRLTPPVAGAEVPAAIRKHNSIKSYLGAITATCVEFGIPKPPHKQDVELQEKLKLWKDADQVGQAHPFDFVEDLPKLWSACWTMTSWSKMKSIKNWAMFLISICMFARASDVTTHCPLYEDCRLPTPGMWDDDGLPQFIEVCMKDWKSRSRAKKGHPYYMRIWRNYKDARFCPVYWLLAYLNYAKVTSGPIFQTLSGGAHLTPDSWTNQTDMMFKKAGLYTAKHFDQEKQVVVPKRGCTNHSIRRSAAQWAGRCDAREVDVRNAGRWKTGRPWRSLLTTWLRAPC